MDADGSNQRLLLAESDFVERRPSFTSDGGSVIFSRCRIDVDGTCALYQIRTNGSDLESITTFDVGISDLSPRYSSDGPRFSRQWGGAAFLPRCI
jgi:Tol biopolymer transport system component